MAVLPFDENGNGKAGQTADSKHESEGKGRRPIADRYAVTTGRYPCLQHDPGEWLEHQRPTIDCGVPTRNVGDTQPKDLGSSGIRDHFPRCRIRVNDPDRRTHRVVRR